VSTTAGGTTASGGLNLGLPGLPSVGCVLSLLSSC